MRSSTRVITVGTSPVQVADIHPRRHCLIFAGDGINTFTISQDPNLSANVGIVIGTTITAVELRYYNYGDNIQLPFYAICSASTGKMTVIESFF